jgi:hypothetical protein
MENCAIRNRPCTHKSRLFGNRAAAIRARSEQSVLSFSASRSSFLIGELHLGKLGETVVVHSNLPRESSDRQHPRHSADDAGGALLRFSPTGSDASCSVQNQRSPWSPLIRLLSGGSSMRFHCWSLSMSSRPLCFYPFCIVGLKGGIRIIPCSAK